ncbi:MAG: oligosaccharide flippase family protein, partial [Solirubrobacteraceae bacterium]
MATDRDQGEGVVAGALFGLLTQATTAVFTAGLTIYLVRALDAPGFGLFSLGVSLLGIGLLVPDAAVSASAGRFMADRRQDTERVRDVVATALGLKLAGAVSVGAVVALAAGPIAGAYGKPGFEAPLRAFAIALAAEALLLLWLEVFISLRRLALSARLIFVESLVEASASVALVALGGGVTGAALGRAAGYVVAVVLGVAMVARLLGRGALDLRRSDRALRWEIVGYARPLFATTAAFTAYGAIDTQLIALLLSSAEIGVWSAPLRLLSLLAYVALAVSNAIAPRMSLEASGGPDVRAFNAGLRWLLVLHVAITVVVVVWAGPIVSLVLGPEFAESANVLRAMGPLILLLGISPLASTTVNYLGEASRRLPIVLTSFVVNAAIDVVLLPAIGVVGAAIGTTIAYLIYVPAHLRLFRLPPYLPLPPP